VFGAPEQISTGFASLLRYCSDVDHQRPTKLCTMFGRLLAWYTMCTVPFSGLLPRDGILPGAKFPIRRTFAFSYIGSVTARHCSSGRQPNFAAWYSTQLNSMSCNGRRCKHLFVRISMTLIYIYVSDITFTYLSPVPVRSAVKSNFTSWSIQNLSKRALNTLTEGIKLRNFRRGRHLYSAGRPSRWIAAHILVLCKTLNL